MRWALGDAQIRQHHQEKNKRPSSNALKPQGGVAQDRAMSRNEGAGDQIVGHDEDLAMQGITLRLDRGHPQIT